MSRTIVAHPFSLFSNPRADRGADYGPHEREILSRAGFDAAYREISSWPGYAPTPLVALPGLAAAAGIAMAWYKDEGGRFCLGSFKALGGAYAVFRVLADDVGRRAGDDNVKSADLVGGRYRDITSAITVTAATDGNHGRSVAWGARTFGCRCVIYLPTSVSEWRQATIARYGAEVVCVPGTFDDAVRWAAADAARNGWYAVPDTAGDGGVAAPRHVMQGYTVMVDEVIRQLSAGERPTHAFVQVGVGGLAAAVCAHMWESWGRERPRFIVVEPEKADCAYQSAVHGRPTTVEGNLDTVMAGLAAGEVSPLAWRILERGADAFMTVPDSAALDCVVLLADGVDGDRPVVAGESAVGGLAGLLAAAMDPRARRDLGLGAASRVLLIGSEGDTDPELYRRIVGRTGEEVRAAAVASTGASTVGG